MQAEEISVGKLFVGDQQLLIPLWQRHYSWGRPQWTELWTDLLRAQEGDEQQSHFVGSFVLKTLPWSGLPSEARRYWVVDGQQRVTTLTLLACAVRDRLGQLAETPEEGKQVVASYTAQLLKNTNLKSGHVDRLILQERDRVVLAPIVSAMWAGDSGASVDKAYSFFRTKLSAFDSPSCESLLATMLTKLRAVWVTLEASDNAHRVFQTLNAGGKKLEPADLVRNYFFLLLGELGDRFYEDHWRSLEGDFTDAELRDYLIAWSISQGHSGAKDSLFAYFHRDLLPVEHNADQVLAYGTQLVDSARYFRWVRQPIDAVLSDSTKRSLIDIGNWGPAPAEGLVFWLIQQFASKAMSDLELGQCLETVLSFMARRQLAGYEPNLHRPIFTAIAHKLQDGMAQLQDIPGHLRYLLSIGEEVRIWPTDDTIKARIRTTPIYASARSRWTFTILERINREYFENKKNLPGLALDRSKYSVEHVMPQTITPDWFTDLKTWGVANGTLLHQTKLHCLGNLSLTPINGELQNYRFVQKRELLSDDWLPLNVEIASAQTWTENGIDERSLALAIKACSAFVAPVAGDDLAAAAAKYGTKDQIDTSTEDLVDPDAEGDTEAAVEGGLE